MTDVISALTIISVCSVLLVYWVVRMFRLCLAPTELTDETLGSSKQAIKAGYGARFFGGMEFIVPHRTGPGQRTPAQPSAPGNVHRIPRPTATIRTIRLRVVSAGLKEQHFRRF
jgi:hypothetical protein